MIEEQFYRYQASEASSGGCRFLLIFEGLATLTIPPVLLSDDYLFDLRYLPSFSTGLGFEQPFQLAVNAGPKGMGMGQLH